MIENISNIQLNAWLFYWRQLFLMRAREKKTAATTFISSFSFSNRVYVVRVVCPARDGNQSIYWVDLHVHSNRFMHKSVWLPHTSIFFLEYVFKILICLA